MLDQTIIHASPHELAEPETNPNVMENQDFSMLKAAIQRVGFLQPVLVRSNTISGYDIIDGVHRVRAAKELGLQEVPCVVIDPTKAETKAIQIGMNRLRGELDLSRVAQSLSELANEGWTQTELALTGFAEDEIESLLKAMSSTSEDDLVADAAELDSELERKTSNDNSILEVEFATKKEMLAAKRKLRKLAGKGNPLGNAIIQLLEVDDG